MFSQPMGQEDELPASAGLCGWVHDGMAPLSWPCATEFLPTLVHSCSAFNEPLRQYLAALTPLAHYVTRFSLRDLERASKADWDALYDTFPQLLMAKQAKQ